MSRHQPAILDEVPAHARYLGFQRLAGEDPRKELRRLARSGWDEGLVVGLGASLVSALDRAVPGLRPFPALVNQGIALPSTPVDLWIWARGEDPGALVHTSRRLEALLEDSFALDEVIDAFRHGAGLDLSGYEDGTENPAGEAAREAALVEGLGEGLDGSSFVAVQRWHHDLDAFEGHPVAERDAIFGRRIADNEEIEDAPLSAHVKRTAQEDFEPEAWVVRRSMPWADAEGEGLVFTAFGNSLDRYEMILRRMMGFDDDITDALFRWTTPTSGAYLWCPPVRDGALDLRALGL